MKRKIGSPAIVCVLLFGSFFLMTSLTSENVKAVSTWSIETVDPSAGMQEGEYTSIALDSSGHPHISYYDRTANDLGYAYFNGTSWNVEMVDEVSNVGDYSSIALDASDRPHISYYYNDFENSDWALKYAYFNGTFWHKWIADDGPGPVGDYTSLALDSSGNPHISYEYFQDFVMKCAYFDGTSWIKRTVDPAPGIGSDTSLALDSSGNPHISYCTYNINTNGHDLKYAYPSGSGWSTVTVDSGEHGRFYTSLALDASDHPHISYYDWQNFAVKYAYFDGAFWHIETIDAEEGYGFAFPGCHSSLALDSSGNPHIVYDEFPKLYIRYAHFNGTSWHRETMVDWDGFVVGYDPSLALDSEGRAHIGFYGETLDMRIALRYARQGPSAAAPEPPTGLTATPGDNQVTLSWKAPSSDGGLLITNHKIYRGAFSGEESFYTEVGNVSSYIDTWAMNGNTYYYQVSAKNFVGESQKSNEVSATPTAQSRMVGVDVGQWFEYADVTVSWESNDPNATVPQRVKEINDTTWFRASVEDVSGTNITFECTEHFEDGITRTRIGYIDMDTGDSCNNTADTIEMTYMAISANLEENDAVYASAEWATKKMNETVVRLYPDGERYINHINTTVEGSQMLWPDEIYLSTSMNIYWDKSTGMLVEMSYEESYQKGEYLTTTSWFIRITESNVWTVPEFPTWTSMLLILTVLTVTIAIYKRRLFKTPIH